MHRPTIAIIGAGPAGLTAANILQRHDFQVTVFEADAAAAARDQGGTLDLHVDGGQRALARAGLLEAFLAVARHEDQELRIADHASGALLREVIPPPGTTDRPEIDRLELRRLLLQPLAGGTVHWNARTESVSPHPDGGHWLHLPDRTVGPFDLVIGADGAWSRARAALSDVAPAYSGVTFVELWLHEVDARHPAVAALVGHGTLFALHAGAGLFAQRNGRAMIRVYAALRTPEGSIPGIRIPQLLERFDGWAPALRAVIAGAERIAAVRPIVALPAGTRWREHRGLTLVGDAAHVMPPLGVGVNLAMLDAADLATAIVGSQDWEQAVRDCEAAIVARAEPLARDCSREFAGWFGGGGIQSILENVDAHGPPSHASLPE